MAISTLRERFLLHVAQTSDFPPAVEFTGGEGCWLIGADGRRYLDLISGISVNNLGHRHPEVTEAIHHQVDSYLHVMVYGEFVLSPQVEFASRIAGLLPDKLSSVFFTNSGAEAIEGAMKLSKRHTGRTNMVGFRRSYHGSTQGALSITGDDELQRNFRPLLPGILHLEYGNHDELRLIDNHTACVVMEVIQAEAGCRQPSPEYLHAVRNRCNETGALLVFDEIQTGMGRTGNLFAFEHTGVVPDILVLGKAFGGGMPLGAFISSSSIMKDLTHNPVLGNITTYGGHPVCCAAGHASLEVILRERLFEKAMAKGEIFKKLLVHPQIKGVHGRGLLLAVEFESFEMNRICLAKCMDNGLVADWFLFAPDHLRIAPPLTISEQEIHEACRILLSSLPN
ncbi:MAG: aspartate aminotransferase family protein [Bacteroidota bacterium]